MTNKQILKTTKQIEEVRKIEEESKIEEVCKVHSRVTTSTPALITAEMLTLKELIELWKKHQS